MYDGAAGAAGGEAQKAAGGVENNFTIFILYDFLDAKFFSYFKTRRGIYRGGLYEKRGNFVGGFFSFVF